MHPGNTTETLAGLGAPSGVLAMAQLHALHSHPTGMEKIAPVMLRAWELLSQAPSKSWPVLPEFRALIDLDRRLPASLQIAPAADAARGATLLEKTSRAKVKRVVEAMTPWFEVPASFTEASRISDNPADWAMAAPQITVIGCADRLPANGALARWRLHKRTELLKPIQPGLATEEIIEIAVEGRDGPGGCGHRRYTHRLVSDKSSGPVELLGDTGWIELSGGATRCLLRLHKRVVFALPEDLDEEFGALFPTGLSSVLWSWAAGFVQALKPDSQRDATEPQQPPRPENSEDPPSEKKRVVPSGDVVQVAVLGGGPAGLACAWLLSNPEHEGAPSWTLPPQAKFRVEVQVVEKECRLGGKAASGRRDDAEQFRIEEHGLHVLMGFYKNVLQILASEGAASSLHNVSTVLVPCKGHDLQSAWKVTLGPWEAPGAPTMPLLEWLRKEGGSNEDVWKLLERAGVFDVGPLLANGDAPSGKTPRNPLFFMLNTRPSATPLLRSFLRTWQVVADLFPDDECWGTRHIENLELQLLLRRLVLAEMGFAAHLESGEQLSETGAWLVNQSAYERVAPLAKILRNRGRAALRSSAARVQLARELLELTTTISIGLDTSELFPMWALDKPADLVGESNRYRRWVKGIQRLDAVSLSEWLRVHGADREFVDRSHILASVTAGLFTKADGIGAGTFINGLARLLLAYDDAPFKYMKGGTGEALIGPMYDAIRKRGVEVKTGTKVVKLSIDAQSGIATSAHTLKTHDEDLSAYKVRPGAVRPGWPSPAACKKIDPEQAEDIVADAFVLAMPPFCKTLDGLPAELAEALGELDSCATVGIQHWTTGPAHFNDTIVASLDGPLRCAAAMNQLLGCEGPGVTHAPVYYCGEVDDETAERLKKDTSPIDTWLEKNASTFQLGKPTRPANCSVNNEGSERYVYANVKTQRARRYPWETGVPNLWMAGDWTRSALSCGSIEAAVTSGLEAARDILVNLGCEVRFPIVGACVERINE